MILDEFQRFRDLLQPNDEAGKLAQRVFEYSDEVSVSSDPAAVRDAVQDVHAAARAS